MSELSQAGNPHVFQQFKELAVLGLNQCHIIKKKLELEMLRSKRSRLLQFFYKKAYAARFHDFALILPIWTYMKGNDLFNKKVFITFTCFSRS